MLTPVTLYVPLFNAFVTFTVNVSNSFLYPFGATFSVIFIWSVPTSVISMFSATVTYPVCDVIFFVVPSASSILNSAPAKFVDVFSELTFCSLIVYFPSAAGITIFSKSSSSS